ncbi:patatin-like phospholipase family protein [Marisediminitalea sp.]|uniref:patatin-like phospholipase family protein n=1 Tax=Marisediminitalea sp. TaxID=2662268 RepID=UPI0035151527
MRKVTISLALQGGGAHGAFTWGVLNRLLEEKWLTFEGLSGASAGAMNAVMLAEGWRKGKQQGAKQQLADFWYAVASQNIDFALPEEITQSVTQWWLNAFQMLSPYNINLLDVNPLRDIVEANVDFKKLQRDSPFSLYISATEVSTGKLALFNADELTSAHLLASACLPSIHKAVEVSGKHYWDGGFAGNPAIYPLIHQCKAKDILIVLLQPLIRDELPTSAQDISDRVTEIGFHSNFMREMNTLARIRTMLKGKKWLLGKLEKQINALRLHLITNTEVLGELDAATKYNNRKGFLDCLREAGEQTADHWLDAHADALGKRETCDLTATF